MKIFLEVEVTENTIPFHVHDAAESIRRHVESDLAAWNNLDVTVGIADDPGEQYNRGYDDGRDAMYVDMVNEQGAQAY